jgi:hypothetical protein
LKPGAVDAEEQGSAVQTDAREFLEILRRRRERAQRCRSLVEGELAGASLGRGQELRRVLVAL